MACNSFRINISYLLIATWEVNLTLGYQLGFRLTSGICCLLHCLQSLFHLVFLGFFLAVGSQLLLQLAHGALCLFARGGTAHGVCFAGAGRSCMTWLSLQAHQWSRRNSSSGHSAPASSSSDCLFDFLFGSAGQRSQALRSSWVHFSVTGPQSAYPIVWWPCDFLEFLTCTYLSFGFE